MGKVPVVLVVEDDEPLQEIVHDALKEGGFDVTTVASGQEAVAMIEIGVLKYSALVTDINLRCTSLRRRWAFASTGPAIGPFPTSYAAYRNALISAGIMDRPDALDICELRAVNRTGCKAA